MDRSPAGQKRAAPPEATPSLLKSSHLLPWQHYVSACARTPRSVSLWTRTPHQPAAGRAAAQSTEGCRGGRAAVPGGGRPGSPLQDRLAEPQRLSETSACLEGLVRTCPPTGGSPPRAFYLLSNLRQMTCAEQDGGWGGSSETV